ncbi:hypothetical protein P9G84_21640 [Brevibacillus centrosporus]|uniref:Uncharacterized protein n=2 Tax=Brevibacillus centrosporus TaxID=54910 RepID=A0A1I4D095_9BACL|nr:hypothetical protein [Brevibacillus centrosporus]MEC2131529.1 hypothetical protein [Brevibacillus centrosporus]RNB72024.1 hypothetical protein EDM55_06395 [Brevibacillus centrosporus]GED32543.1 hypothetical protein BCE02nite_36840 [Brevibacillus centrosporus]SFK86998.1 hypothetical protein SAMN05518846_12230 [Brevibacillus centrosporus]
MDNNDAKGRGERGYSNIAVSMTMRITITAQKIVSRTIGATAATKGQNRGMHTNAAAGKSENEKMHAVAAVGSGSASVSAAVAAEKWARMYGDWKHEYEEDDDDDEDEDECNCGR